MPVTTYQHTTPFPLTDCNHSHNNNWDEWRPAEQAVGADGVAGRWIPHGRRHGDVHGRVPDRHRLPRGELKMTL